MLVDVRRKNGSSVYIKKWKKHNHKNPNIKKERDETIMLECQMN
jgi:hypothetical protein